MAAISEQKKKGENIVEGEMAPQEPVTVIVYVAGNTPLFGLRYPTRKTYVPTAKSMLTMILFGAVAYMHLESEGLMAAIVFPDASAAISR